MTKIYQGIDPKKALVATLVFLGLFIAHEVDIGRKIDRLYERHYKIIEYYRMEQVDTSIPPERRDLNRDGLDDLILKLKSGEDFVLYGTSKGYQYEDPRRK